MGVLATALTNLAGVIVPGVMSYALDDAPDRLARAQLPALVIMPEVAADDAPGMQPLGFGAGDARLVVRIAHVLLAAPVAAGVGRRGLLPDLIDHVDSYVAALAADPTLNGALPLALRFDVHIGVLSYGGVAYYGAVFAHEWTLHVT